MDLITYRGDSVTRDETKGILNILLAVFPQNFRHLESDGQRKIVVDEWYDKLCRYPYEEVHKAVDDYIASSNYAPSIAQLREKLNENRKYKRSPSVECNICGGIGGIIYYRYHTDAPVGWYEHMAFCTCEAGQRLPFKNRLDYDIRQIKNLLKHDNKFKLSMPLNQQQTPPENIGEKKVDVETVMERLKVMVDVK